MSFQNAIKSTEFRFVVVCFVITLLALLFMGSLVAAPKVLFGRALTAIAPSLFPSLVLSVLVILCAALVFIRLKFPEPHGETAMGSNEWKRGAGFFGIMTAYALLMVPCGFLISSAFATAFMSWASGNRILWQIVLLSLAGPILLYLAATRLLAVSLPELSAIEFAYSRILGI